MNSKALLDDDVGRFEYLFDFRVVRVLFVLGFTTRERHREHLVVVVILVDEGRIVAERGLRIEYRG